MDINQISIAYPGVSTLYTDRESYLKHNVIEIAVSDVLSLTPPPTIILNVDISLQILQQQRLKVSFNIVGWNHDLLKLTVEWALWDPPLSQDSLSKAIPIMILGSVTQRIKICMT